MSTTAPTPQAVKHPEYLTWAVKPRLYPVCGDCLAPVGIVHGDIVIVDGANTRPRHGDIIACTLNGARLLKAYLTDDEEWPVRLGYTRAGEFRSFAVKPSDTLVILGVLVGVKPVGTRRWPARATADETDLDTPLLAPGDLKHLPHWTLDTATDEWVRRRGDGMEISRTPVGRPEVIAAD